MILPLFGFVLGLILFSLLALLVLRVGAVAPVHPRTVAAFVIAAFASTLAYAVIYGRIFGNAGQLESTVAVIGFLVGALLVATICGAVAAKLAARTVAGGRV
jgi:hypothetical protein